MITHERSYDTICFGDEIPGILALVCASREYRRRTGKFLRLLLMSKGSKYEAIGGHLVRGGLAYLDRCQISPEIRRAFGLDTFGDPCAIYKEFLQRCGVIYVALDPYKAAVVLEQMRREADITLIRDVEIESVLKEGNRITGITIARGETYYGKQFIDATVNAQLAQAAGVEKFKGFETFGLPESELPVTLVFETEGLRVNQLRQIELSYLQRFTNPLDTQAQEYILHAAGFDRKFADVLRQDLVDSRGSLKRMAIGRDYIDICSKALSIAYHSYRGTKLLLQETGIILDRANIAILPNKRLSWNALLCYVNGTEAEELAQAGAKPPQKIIEEMAYVEQWLKSIGATSVRTASELYIRHAGNITGVVEPLTGAMMLRGGVPEHEALGTFAYHFDVRGGIKGIGAKAYEKGFSSLSFSKPIFNIGIHHTQVKEIPNLAVVSPASGFEGFAAAAGRIVEFNVMVGQGVGIAVAIALLSNRNLAEISNSEVRYVLEQTGQLPQIYGIDQSLEASRLNDLETTVV